jgi:hypothetical protein
MDKKILIGISVFVFTLCSVAATWGYQIEYSYGPRANYAYAYSDHVYELNNGIDAWTFDEGPGTATAEVHSPAQAPSAITQVITSPIGAGPVATVNLQVTDRTASYSYCYGWADTRASFTIIKEAGDIADQVPIKFTFHVTSLLNFQNGAYYSYSYSFYLDDSEMHRGTTGLPTLDDLFIATVDLDVGVPHTFGVSLDGSLSHSTYRLDTALYQATLGVQIQRTPLPPSLLLLGTGFLGLGVLGWLRQRD